MKTLTSYLSKIAISLFLGFALVMVSTGSAFASTETDPALNLNNTSIDALEDEDCYCDGYEFFDPFEGIISEEDWENLSDAEIDAKLREAGFEIEEAHPEDPLYHLTPDEIDALTDEQWEEIEAKYREIYGDDVFEEDEYDDDFYDEDFEDPFDEIITEEDWENLSLAEIDAKLREAGYDVPEAHPEDPLYHLTPAEIEALSDEEWEAIEAKMDELYGDDMYEDDEWDDYGDYEPDDETYDDFESGDDIDWGDYEDNWDDFEDFDPTDDFDFEFPEGDEDVFDDFEPGEDFDFEYPEEDPIEM